MDSPSDGQSPPEFFGRVPQAFLKALCSAYADLVKRQRTTGSAFVNWTPQTSRSHEFSWIGGAESKESLISLGGALRVSSSSPLHPAVQKMQATAKLNPYEREVLYGYPYVIGRLGSQSLRGPLFTIPVTIEPDGAGFVVRPAEETVRFNTLVFRTEADTAAREQALEELLQDTPSFPVGAAALQRFFDAMARHLGDVTIAPTFQPGNLQAPLSEPRSHTPLTIIPQAALFVAPKSSYFLTKDLETLSEEARAEQTALEALLATGGDVAQVDIAAGDEDRKGIFYPFASNRSQRRVAILVDDETTRCVRIDGPPGTGKSLTIANLVCHLVATGRSVLVCSQKDKALQVVDETLRSLNLPELPMTLLHFDRESKEDLRVRLDSIQKERPTAEVRTDSMRAAQAFEQLKGQYMGLSEQFEKALHGEAELVRADDDVAAVAGLPRLWRQIRRWSTHRRVIRRSPASPDELADRASELRDQLLEQALTALGLGAELRTAQATREQKQRLREFSKLLQRNQTSVKNFTIFDQLKKDPTRTHLLLKSLPAWIMNPDDVARLFPCEPGLFDVVIVDEASQVDLPSQFSPWSTGGRRSSLPGI